MTVYANTASEVLCKSQEMRGLSQSVCDHECVCPLTVHNSHTETSLVMVTNISITGLPTRPREVDVSVELTVQQP